MKLVIIIPTYDERENIEQLVPEIFSVMKDTEYETHILVADDSSPDGTAAVVRRLMEEHECLHLLNGKKAGLGAAYKRGMTYVTDALNPDIIMEMDADFSHDPHDIPRLLEKIGDYDFVIGSRHVKGGSIPDEWGIHRKMNSYFGNIAARWIAGFYHVHDCTAGFRAMRAAILEQVNFEALSAKGYGFQMSLLHEVVLTGARIIEVPVHFKDRTSGKSKLGISDIVEFLFMVWMIRLEKTKTFMRYFVVRLCGVREHGDK